MDFLIALTITVIIVSVVSYIVFPNMGKQPYTRSNFIRRPGVISIFLGALAVPIAFAATHASRSHIPGSGAILQRMDNMGLVKQPINGVETLSETSLFAINDQNGINLLFAAAIALAVASMGCALLAEYRREPTLYLSGGYVCGAIAIWLIKPSAGFVLLMVGVIAVLVLRHGRDT